MKNSSDNHLNFTSRRQSLQALDYLKLFLADVRDGVGFANAAMLPLVGQYLKKRQSNRSIALYVCLYYRGTVSHDSRSELIGMLSK